MRGQHHVIEDAGEAARVFEGHMIASAVDLPDPDAQVDLVPQRLAETLDIASAAAEHAAPLGPSVEGQQAMAIEKPQKGKQGIVSHVLGRRRPDRRPHGQEMLFDEAIGIALLGQEGSQVDFLGPRRAEKAGRFLIESLQVFEHAPETRRDEVAPLAEHGVQPRRPILEPATVEGDGEGHVAGVGRNAEMVEERYQVRVVAIVIDDEPGVDRNAPPGDLHIDRVRVAAAGLVSLEDRHIVPLVQQPGR